MRGVSRNLVGPQVPKVTAVPVVTAMSCAHKCHAAAHVVWSCASLAQRPLKRFRLNPPAFSQPSHGSIRTATALHTAETAQQAVTSTHDDEPQPSGQASGTPHVSVLMREVCLHFRPLQLKVRDARHHKTLLILMFHISLQPTKLCTPYLDCLSL